MVTSLELVKKLAHFRVWKIVSGICYIIAVIYLANIILGCGVSCPLKQAAELETPGIMWMFIQIAIIIGCCVYGLIATYSLYLNLKPYASLPLPVAHFNRFKTSNVGTIVLIVIWFILSGMVQTPSRVLYINPALQSIAVGGLIALLPGIPAEIVASGYKSGFAKMEAAEKVSDKQAIEQMKRRVEEEAKAGAFAATLEQEFDKWGQGTEKATNTGGKVDAPAPSVTPGERVEKARKLVRMSSEVTIPDLASVLQVSRAQLLDKLLEGDGAPGVRVNGDHIVIENNDAFAEFLARAFAR